MTTTSYKITVRGERAIDVSRKGTDERGSFTVKATRREFRHLADSLDDYLRFPPTTIPTSVGFLGSTETLEAFDSGVRAWVQWYNATQREELLALTASGAKPKRAPMGDAEGIVY